MSHSSPEQNQENTRGSALSGQNGSANHQPISEIDALRRECAGLKAALDDANAEREQLIRQLRRARFGRSSEQVDPEQAQLALENGEQELAAGAAAVADATAKAESAAAGSEAQAAAKPRRAPARRNRGHLPPHLERLERLVDLADKTCPWLAAVSCTRSGTRSPSSSTWCRGTCG